jgi:ABC-type uncharacterized transport system permease subunit
MNILVLSSMSVALYVFGTLYQLLAYLRKVKLQPFTAFFIGVTASLSQLVITGQQAYFEGSINLNVLNSASLVTAIIVLSLALLSIKRPLHIVMMIMYPLSITTLIAMLTLQFGEKSYQPQENGIFAHIMLSVVAYCVLSIAAIQAVLIYIQNNNLKKRNQIILLRNLPPLLTMEKLLFEMLWSGTILLGLAIVAGFIFVDNLFAQHLAHKTFFSILALLIFSTLLYGRQKHGWRGVQASKLTLWGAVFLMLGFFGSKLALEWLLA